MLRFALLAIALLLAASLGEAAEFWRIEGFHSGPERPILSRDGRIVVGQVLTESRGRAAAFWTADQGLETIALPDGYDSVRVRGMTGDATVISGYLATPTGGEAFVWSKDTSYKLIEQPTDLYRRSEALDVSANGTAVGWFNESIESDEQAFVWTADQGMVPLGDLPGGDLHSKALAVSDDGSVIVGEANARGPDQQEPVVWTQQDGMIRLATDLEPGAAGGASAVSPDGKIVVGSAGWGHGTGGAFRWTKDTGVEFIGVYGAPTGLSDDGKVIVGFDNGPPNWGNTQGFIWNEGLGGRRVSMSLFHDHGVGESVFNFGVVTAVSGDGLTVLGTLPGSGEHYLARLTDDALPGDVNFDDRVDLDDFAVLRKGFGKGIYRDQGDTNLDRRVDLTDFEILKAKFGTVREAAVPEPSSLVLSLAGVLLVASARILHRGGRAEGHPVRQHPLALRVTTTRLEELGHNR